MFGLTDGAPEALSRTGMPAHWNAEQHTEPMAAQRWVRCPSTAMPGASAMRSTPFW